MNAHSTERTEMATGREMTLKRKKSYQFQSQMGLLNIYGLAAFLQNLEQKK